VVVLLNARRVIDVEGLGRFLLKNEWQADHRSFETMFTNQVPKLLEPPVPTKLDQNFWTPSSVTTSLHRTPVDRLSPE
jgi:hypothetical protein